MDVRADTLESNGWDRDCDLIHLSLDLTIDFEQGRVHGTTTNWIRALREETRKVRLHAEAIEVREVRDAAGRTLDFELEPPLLVIALAEPLEVGEEESLTVRYAARPQRGMFFRDTSKHAGGFAPQVWTHGQKENNRHWLPTWDYPNDRATFDATLRVGMDMMALSNGELLKVDMHGDGERTYHWRTTQAIPTYLVAIAAGRWERYADEWRGLPVEYYVAPGSGEERARRAFGETPAMLEFFSTLLDEPFPFAKYAQVAVAGFDARGMENASLTLLYDDVIGDAGEVGDLDGDPRLLVAHEAAHQWFGDLVTCWGWSHLWLNEAWASYLELLYERHVTDPGNYALWLERYRERYLLRSDAHVPMALDWRTQSAGERANHVYDKGPWILHMMRERMGDEAFWRGTRAYLDRHAWGLVTTSDFVRSMFDETGVNLEGFLEQWVQGGGHPELGVRMRITAGEPASLALEVTQEQGARELVPVFDVDLDVDLHFAGGSVVRHVLRVDAREQAFSLPLAGALVDVVLDPDAVLLASTLFDKSLDMWLHQATLAGSPALQWRALHVLRTFAESDERDERAQLAILHVAAESPQPLLRERAAALADFDDPRAVDVLVGRVTTDDSPRVRHAAAQALLRHPRRIEPSGRLHEALLARVEVEPSPAVREALLELLDIEP